MKFKSVQLTRRGEILFSGKMEELFPLLCPKREEDWILGWECETIYSKSGYNEEGAIFRTEKPYGTELYWTTLQYDIKSGTVDFLITAPRLYNFRFRIEVHAVSADNFRIDFFQTFTSVSEDGSSMIKKYENEDFSSRLKNLQDFMAVYIEKKRKQ